MIIKRFSRLMTMFTFMAALMLLLSLPAAAAVQVTDFSCHGVSLGDSDGAVIDAFGQPLFEKTVSIQGILVKECDFDGDFTIGFAVMTGKVIDITIKNQKYEFKMQNKAETKRLKNEMLYKIKLIIAHKLKKIIQKIQSE